MKHEHALSNKNIKSGNEFTQCAILWKKLPPVFKVRWRGEAEKYSISGYKLFIKTNVHNLITGNEIKISPCH